jgi:hypothetical protein
LTAWGTVRPVDIAAGAQTIEVATARAAPATRHMAVFEGDMEISLVGGYRRREKPIRSRTRPDDPPAVQPAFRSSGSGADGRRTL